MATHSSIIAWEVLLPGKSHGWRGLMGCSPWGHQKSDTTEPLHFHFSLSCIGEGNGNPLQCSCLENPRDGGAWWAVIYGVAQSRTRLKRLSSKVWTWCSSCLSLQFRSSQIPKSENKVSQEQNFVFVYKADLILQGQELKLNVITFYNYCLYPYLKCILMQVKNHCFEESRVKGMMKTHIYTALQSSRGHFGSVDTRLPDTLIEKDIFVLYSFYCGGQVVGGQL